MRAAESTRRPARPRRIGFDVDQREGEVDVGDSVAEGVVDLQDHPDVIVGEAVDEPHLPQRPCAIEGERLHAAHERGELVVVAGPRECRQADVIADVEVLVVDPHRPGLVVRHLHHPLTQARNPVDASCDVSLEFVETDPSARIA